MILHTADAQAPSSSSAAPPRPEAGPGRAPVPAGPGRARHTLLIAVLAGVALALGLGGWHATGASGGGQATSFEVWDHGRGEVAFARELEVGDRFRLEHTHSVTRRPVVETFSVGDASTIALEELWFDEPGPNLPAGADAVGHAGATFLHEDGAFRVLHHGHPIGSLPLMVGGVGVDHQLVFEDGQRVRLLDVVRRGERVELTVGGPAG